MEKPIHTDLFGAVEQSCALGAKLTKKARLTYGAAQWRLVALRETWSPDCEMTNPEHVAAYHLQSIQSDDRFTTEVETFSVVMVNTRRRCLGHSVISNGTLDTLLVHPREVFRVAIVAGAAAIVLTHNHPSGDPRPSEADIKVTRDLIRAGQLLKIEVLDHVVVGFETASTVGAKHWVSLREMGYFYNQS